MAKKNPSIFSTLQKTAENASSVNSEVVRQLPLDALEDNPMNRFSMEEDEQFHSTMSSMEKVRAKGREAPWAGASHTTQLKSGSNSSTCLSNPPLPESWAKPPSPARSGSTRINFQSCGL